MTTQREKDLELACTVNYEGRNRHEDVAQLIADVRRETVKQCAVTALAVVRETIEQCAQECERQADLWDTRCSLVGQHAAIDCAKAIRGLK